MVQRSPLKISSSVTFLNVETQRSRFRIIRCFFYLHMKTSNTGLAAPSPVAPPPSPPPPHIKSQVAIVANNVSVL